MSCISCSTLDVYRSIPGLWEQLALMGKGRQLEHWAAVQHFLHNWMMRTTASTLFLYTVPCVLAAAQNNLQFMMSQEPFSWPGLKHKYRSCIHSNATSLQDSGQSSTSPQKCSELLFVPHSHIQEQDKTRNPSQGLIRGLSSLATGYQKDQIGVRGSGQEICSTDKTGVSTIQEEQGTTKYFFSKRCWLTYASIDTQRVHIIHFLSTIVSLRRQNRLLVTKLIKVNECMPRKHTHKNRDEVCVRTNTYH